MVRDSDTTVYAIGLGANVDRPALEALAALSGGTATFPADASQLDAEFRRVLDELRRRYVVGYTSTNSKRDGGWRQVVVGVRQPGITIRSGGGYFAPITAKPPQGDR